MMRAVLYCRVSTEEQTKNLSLQTQQKACADYCQRHSLEVDKVFVEEGESAKTTNRTEFQKLLAYCRENKGRVQTVVVYSLSRFARNANDHLAVRALLSGFGVSLRSVNEQIDESSTGKFLESVLAAVNQLDNDMRADRTKAGMQAALSKGRWTHQAPIGYLNAAGKDGQSTLIPDPDRAGFVRKAFDLCATGLHTKRDVLRIVTNEGLRTVRSNKRVTPQTFDRVLRNPIYAGWLLSFDGSVRTRGSFEPLVTDETFNRAQAVLDGKRLSVTPHQRNHPEFPLRRFVRCGHCERPLTGSKSTGRKGVRYAYYHCPRCGKVRVHKVEFEQAFTEYLTRLQPKPGCVRLLNEIILDEWKQKQAESLAQTTALDHQLNELQERKDKLADAVIDRVIDPDTYQRKLDKLNEEITLAEIAANDAKLDAFDVVVVLNFSEHVILNAARLWTEYSLAQKQRLQRILFPEGVTFTESGFGTAATSLIFNLLQQPEGEKTRMATPTGFEPVLPP